MAEAFKELPASSLFMLESISYSGGSRYLVRMTRGETEITSHAEVKQVDGRGLGMIDVVEFESEAFNKLCTMGEIYAKPIGPAILAFHRCIHF